MASGSMAVFSPVSLTPEVHDMVNALGGKVRYIAALDLEHHLQLTAWKEAFPDAEIIAPEGLWEKRQSSSSAAIRETKFEHVFTKESARQGKKNSVSDEFDAEFETEYVYGHPSRELVFLHKPSRTLIEADLLFNLPAREQYSRTRDGPSGLLTKIANTFMSAAPPASLQKRFAWYLLASADRQAFRQSVRRIDQWDFNRLVPCHGDVVESGAKGVFRTVMEWFLEGNKKEM
jgi:glyoxylase-like metal-dependent hydrolase (beta-lactamase superfamily II)